MLREILFVLALCLVGFIGFDILEGQRDTARVERDAAQLEVERLQGVARLTEKNLATAAANDARHTQELNDALKSNKKLRLAVDAGAQRLRVRAACPTVRSDSGTAGVADAVTAELDRDARPDYFAHRDQLALSEQMILGLQDHVRSFCMPTTTTPGATQ